VRRRPSPPKALTIAGSDSGGGAGIQADLKTFAALGVHGMSAITSITAQNTLEVRGIQDVTPEMVALQIDAVAQDIGVDAAKTGMLSRSEIIEVVAAKVEEHGFPLVVDPVMIAKSGARLLREDAISTLVSKLVPLASVITPNKMEAEVLSGLKIEGLEDAKKAAKKIIEELHPKVVVVKGGHISGAESTDVVYNGKEFKLLSAPRVPEDEGCTHGTGCSFSAAIAAYIAWGLKEVDAVKKAKEFITGAIKYSYKVGRGHCPVNPMHYVAIDAEKYRAISSMLKAYEVLSSAPLSTLRKIVPETRMDVAACLPPWYVLSLGEVAAFPGGLALVGSKLAYLAPPEFGAGGDAALLLYEAVGLDPSVRGLVKAAYSEELLEAARQLGYAAFSLDWRKEGGEPASSAERLKRLLSKALEAGGGRLPDFVAELGRFGKEDYVAVFGSSAEDAAFKLLKAAEKL